MGFCVSNHSTDIAFKPAGLVQVPHFSFLCDVGVDVGVGMGGAWILRNAKNCEPKEF